MMITCKAKLNAFRNRDGAAFTTVMIMMVVFMMIVTSIISLFTNNLKQAKYQESKTQAYYLALSGVDLGLSALMKEDALGEKLLDDFKWDPDVNPDMADDLADKPVLTDELTVGDGTVYITISAMNTGTVREVKVLSQAVLTASGISDTLTLILEADNPMIQKWE